MRYGLFCWIILCSFIMGIHGCKAVEQTAPQPVYPPYNKNEASLQSETAPFLAMSENELLALAPPQGGFYFGDCPNCDQGDEENQIEWNLALGDKARCKYCKATFPSEKHPENGQVVVKTPTGKQQTFKYFQDTDGKKYWMESRRWYEQRILLERAAYSLAQLYTLDKSKYAEAGRRSSLILKRFTELYPDYILRFDYPAKEKQFFTNGNDVTGYKNLPDGAYRIAKWSWWAYMDVSRDLLLTYDLLGPGNFFTADEKQRIEKDFFGAQLEFVKQYDGTPLNNMHPTLWVSQIIAARVLERPTLSEDVIAQMRQLIGESFTYDGIWHEGTASYHLQTTGGVHYGLTFLRPDLKGAAFEEWLSAQYPDLSRAINAIEAFRLPNGRYAAIHDSWAEQDYSPILESSRSYLLPGMGYGILGGGSGKDQWQAHLNFSGRFGHEHYDSLNLLLFAKGRELVSDIGYTHTKARAWTMATAAHNTVLIDGLNQLTSSAPQGGLGSLRLFHASDPNFQVVEADNTNVYDKVASVYRRALIAVASPGGSPYIVDVFNVAGGSRHDWILHGSADDAQTLELAGEDGKPLALQSQTSLLPADFKFEPLTITGNYERITNGQWALGNFRDLQTARSDNTVVATFRNTAEPTSGLRTWMLGAPASTLTTARSWAVRGTGKAFSEDAGKLDNYLRTALFVRRDTAQNQFVAVHQPFAASDTNATQVKRVTQIPLAPDGFALKIERDGGTDYLLFGNDAKARTGRDGNMQIAFDGRIALAQANGAGHALKMLDGTRFQFGAQQLTGKTVPPAKLLKVEGNRYTLAGSFLIATSGILLLQHGGGRTSALHAANVKSEGGNTIVESVEPGFLEGDASGTLKMQTYPRLELSAPHTATTTVLTTTP